MDWYGFNRGPIHHLSFSVELPLAMALHSRLSLVRSDSLNWLEFRACGFWFLPRMYDLLRVRSRAVGVLSYMMTHDVWWCLRSLEHLNSDESSIVAESRLATSIHSLILKFQVILYSSYRAWGVQVHHTPHYAFMTSVDVTQANVSYEWRPMTSLINCKPVLCMAIFAYSPHA